jgi:Ca-activated chloride channel family protein
MTDRPVGLLAVPRTTPRDDVSVPAPVPLAGVSVEAQLAGGAARVTLRQRYRNTESVPVEAVYTFPLDADAAVCGFSAALDARVVTAEVDEREAAFARYDDAMADGRFAVLLDQERPDVFTASVGNLPAGAEAEVTLSMVQPLPREGAAWRFTLPTTVAPRYAPTTRGEVGQPDGDALNPPRALDVPYGLAVRLRLEGATRRVESPSHPIRTEWHDDHVVVELAQAEAAMDRDLVLLVEPRTESLGGAWLAADGDGDVLRVEWLVPEAADAHAHADRPCEVVFVVDCSGSMGGPSIVEAKRALALCLKALQAGDRFDIVRFGSSHRALFGRPRPYGAESLRLALAWVEAMDADLGGTEILPALHAAVRSLPSAREGGRDEQGAAYDAQPLPRREVLLLTDGEVTNEAEVIALAARHAETTRISTFGIGHAASASLVRGVARASGGFTEAIAPRERIEAKVLRTFGRLRAAPLPFRLRVDGDAGGWEPAAPLPDVVYAGELVRVHLRSARAGTGAATVTLSAGAVRQDIPVVAAGASSGDTARDVSAEAAADVSASATANAPADGTAAAAPGTGHGARPSAAAPSLVALCWARERIAQLEAATDRHGSAQRRPGHAERRAQERTAELVALGRRYGLLSSATSYVGVLREVDATRGVPAELRRVPLVPPPGQEWAAGRTGLAFTLARASLGAFEQRDAGVAPMRDRPPRARAAPAGGAGFDVETMPARFDAAPMGAPAGAPPAGAPMDAPMALAPGSPDLLYALLAAQEADGVFAWSDALDVALRGRPMPASGLTDGIDRADRVLVTWLVIGVLQRDFAAYADEWRAAAAKARKALGIGAPDDRIARLLAALLGA